MNDKPDRPNSLLGAREALLALVPFPALLLDGRAGPFDLAVVLAWSTWLAGPVGWLAGGLGIRWGRAISLALVAWSAALAAAIRFGPQRQFEPDLLRALCGLGPALGLAVAGLAWGSRRPRWAAAGAGTTLFAVLLLTALPGRGDLIEAGWAERHPAAAALLLDLSPVTLAAEAAGLDWMRHPAVYGPAGTDWFSDRRRPHGALAGALALVVGCALGLGSAIVRRPDRIVAEPSTGPPCASTSAPSPRT